MFSRSELPIDGMLGKSNSENSISRTRLTINCLNGEYFGKLYYVKQYNIIRTQ